MLPPCTVAIIYDCVSELCDILYTCSDLWITEQIYYGVEWGLMSHWAQYWSLQTYFYRSVDPASSVKALIGSDTHTAQAAPLRMSGQQPIQNTATTEKMLNVKTIAEPPICCAPECTKLYCISKISRGSEPRAGRKQEGSKREERMDGHRGKVEVGRGGERGGEWINTAVATYGSTEGD